MRNLDIITLANAGVMQATGYTLKPAEAYQLFLLKKQIGRAVEAVREAETSLVRDAGIDDPAAFDARTQELSGKGELTEEERRELEEHREKLVRLNGTRRALYEDEAEIRVSPIPYEAWFALQQENAKSNVFGGDSETILENIFWKAPEEGAES